MSTHSHVDLVKALESIDQSVLHDDALSSHEHTHHDHHHHITAIGHHHEASGRQEDLSEWTREELQAEIVKLRQMAGIANDNNMTIEMLPTSAEGSVDPSLRENALATLPVEADGSKGKRKRRSPTNDVTTRKVQKRHTETGKRLEKERRTELAKVIRNKMRSLVGMEFNNSPVPQPTVSLSDEERGFTPFVPEWRNMLDEDNLAWVDKISKSVQDEATNGLYPKVPDTDLVPEIIHGVACTAFANLCKRFINENSSDGADKRERYIKKRRRWARKDLKQKRRSRSAASPSISVSLPASLPASALHIDYMSSEYSSSGDDEPGVHPHIRMMQKDKWREAVEEAQRDARVAAGTGRGGWKAGQGPKVLEVRKPKWRSQQLNEIYARLDAHADAYADTRATGTRPASSSQSTSAAPRAGHVAPSHNRFCLPPELARRGKAPRDLGEGWMWVTGVVGVWPEETGLELQMEAGGAGGQVGDMVGVGVDDAEREQGQNGEAAVGGEMEVGTGVVNEMAEVTLAQMGQWGTNEEVMDEADRLGLVNALDGL
ncbi:hypothetical protein C349_06625 [Cryptococcus neoformans var. grubii Br795]|uniref:Uncharacterized protein n=1 Tax=Cryptococcus neoformans Tu259-1 TaxID=1230072 RepID=A0A854Q1T7_CRYNE|nr:hypothetical protein C353_06534 [Cryptococcus neoformans var. grubii AD1-83a]OXG10673.1 hypothetical protein C361_06706 [Cryptococcus neoformans var. grubii Tu259-1]OXG43695.1 hypothetical protein C355_06542 [Cryptococcus neoformans var. grubii Th84]OXG46335.1 hypothetical protein C354_06518 [Cryptococcus neoformans var. grubii MW-RSA1955]OXG49659.1 hypothetical protein C352_06537 [Cryptococcus neoformans var. grubii CHC193]OXG57005.1 hypothetical protein C351_06563 [Cryptococcus neoformans